MEVKNDMLYSAVQLWQLVTVIQHFTKNFVITGMSLSLTPSPVHVFHRSSSIYFNKKIDMRTARLVQTLHDLLLEAPFCKNAQNILLLFWSCHLLTHKITFFFFFPHGYNTRLLCGVGKIVQVLVLQVSKAIKEGSTQQFACLDLEVQNYMYHFHYFTACCDNCFKTV